MITFIVTRHFKTLSAAERFQNRLYNQYSRVRLMRSPRFEQGEYVWECWYSRHRATVPYDPRIARESNRTFNHDE